MHLRLRVQLNTLDQNGGRNDEGEDEQAIWSNSSQEHVGVRTGRDPQIRKQGESNGYFHDICWKVNERRWLNLKERHAKSIKKNSIKSIQMKS